MNIISIIKNNFLTLVAVATIIGFSSFKLWEKTGQQNLIFVYEAPDADPQPFSEANVKNLSNWSRDTAPCDDQESQEVACSISVPEGNTIDGTELDPSSVSISTLETATNQHRVNSGTGYSNPINKPMP